MWPTFPTSQIGESVAKHKLLTPADSLLAHNIEDLCAVYGVLQCMFCLSCVVRVLYV